MNNETFDTETGFKMENMDLLFMSWSLKRHVN